MKKIRRYIFYELLDQKIDVNQIREWLDDAFRYLYGEVERSLTTLKVFKRESNLVICVSKDNLFRVLFLTTLLKLGMNVKIEYKLISTTYKSGLKRLYEF